MIAVQPQSTPNINYSDSGQVIKNKDYYKNFMLRLMRENFTNKTFYRSRMAEAYNYFINDDSTDQYESLFSYLDVKGDSGTEGDPGMKVPYIYSQFKKIRSKVKHMEGALADLGFGLWVEALNKEAQSQRAKVYRDGLRKMKAKKLFQQMYAAEQAMPWLNNGDIPEDIERLDYWIKNKWKPSIARAVEILLTWTVKNFKYRFTRLLLFRDVLIGGECHADAVIRGGFARLEKWNPKYVITDRSIDSDDHLSDASFILHASYMNIPDVVRMYKLDPKIINNLKKEWREGRWNTGQWSGLAHGNMTVYEPFITMDSYGYNTAKVLVVTGKWMDTERVHKKQTKDKDGQEHVHVYYGDNSNAELKPKEKEFGGQVDTGERQIIEACTLIAGCIVADCGKEPNRISDHKFPGLTQFSHESYIPYLTQGQNVSLTMEVQALEGYRNFLLTKIQHEITKASGTGVWIDIATLDPDIYGAGEEAVDTFMHMLKGHGVVFGNSAEGNPQIPAGYVPVRQIQGGGGFTIEQLLNLVFFVDKEIEEKVSLSKTQMGDIIPNQLKGVTQSALAQGTKAQRGLIIGFLEFESRLLQKLAEKIKIAWALNKEKYIDIVGELHMYNLQHANIPFADVGIFVRVDPITEEEVKQMIGTALSQGPEAMRVMRAMLNLAVQAKTDVMEAIETFNRDVDRMEKQEREQAEKMQEMMGQQQQVAEEQKFEREKALKLMEVEGNLKGRAISADGQVKATTGAAHINSQNKLKQMQDKLNFESFRQKMQDRMAIMALNEKRRNNMAKEAKETKPKEPKTPK
jgi:hypothetical protein